MSLVDEALTGPLPTPVKWQRVDLPAPTFAPEGWYPVGAVDGQPVAAPEAQFVFLPGETWRRTDTGFELDYGNAAPLYEFTPPVPRVVFHPDAGFRVEPAQRMGRGYAPRHLRGKR